LFFRRTGSCGHLITMNYAQDLLAQRNEVRAGLD